MIPRVILESVILRLWKIHDLFVVSFPITGQITLTAFFPAYYCLSNHLKFRIRRGDGAVGVAADVHRPPVADDGKRKTGKPVDVNR